MTFATIKVTCATTQVVCRKPIPAGVVGALVRFEFNKMWDNLRKMVVFRGCVTKDVLLDGTTATIPAEVVERPTPILWIGVYGVNADDTIVIPTLWANVGGVLPATDPSGDTSTDPALPVWAQIQKELGDGIPTKVSQLENDAGYLVAEDVKIPTKVSELENDSGYLTGSGFLTDNEIDMLSKMLMGGSLPCDPVIAVSKVERYEPYYNAQGVHMYTTYYWDISATITGIDKSLIQKVAIGSTITSNDTFSFKQVDVTSTDDTTHTVAYTFKSTSHSAYYKKFVVRLTYYTLFGETLTLLSDEVSG